MDGKHKIKWFYTIDQAPDVVKAIQANIDKVHSIGGIAVVESNHTQILEDDQWKTSLRRYSGIHTDEPSIPSTTTLLVKSTLKACVS